MDVTKLTPQQTIEMLDFILENSYHPKDYHDYKLMMLPKLVDAKLFPDEDEPLLKMALNKLKEDGYLDFVQKKDGIDQWQFISDLSAAEGMTIRRNFNGHLFVGNGGYRQQKINADAENKRVEKLENENRANQTWMIWLTVILAASAFLTLVYYCVDLYWRYHWFRSIDLCLLGFLILLLLWLVLLIRIEKGKQKNKTQKKQ